MQSYATNVATEPTVIHSRNQTPISIRMERAEKRLQVNNSQLFSAVSTKGKQVAFAEDADINSSDREPSCGHNKAGLKIKFNQ